MLWYTKAHQRQLYFVNDLGIPNEVAQVPPMLWFANKNSLSVFALATDRRPTEKTPLHYAPFFNIYEDGRVCMGTVTIDIKNWLRLRNLYRLGKATFLIVISATYWETIAP
ncbi:hypothetical protein [Pedobacter terrae]|uniref:hypothetical protein n=1 Tax=Pedobacter terrae TaxID=405671 RepID=UPI002FFA0D2F